MKCRHVLAKGETLTGLAVQSSIAALEMANVQAQDLDLIVFATSSPDDLFGSACQVLGGCSRVQQGERKQLD
jgi:3-oxoacyl-[acyl-carrier-protein] synthase-3